MKIKILKTKTASSCPLGIYSKEYAEGSVVEMYNELAKVFLKQGWAVEFKDDSERLALIEKEKQIKIEAAIKEEADNLAKSQLEAEKEEADNLAKSQLEAEKEEEDQKKAIDDLANKAIDKAPENKSFSKPASKAKKKK